MAFAAAYATNASRLLAGLALAVAAAALSAAALSRAFWMTLEETAIDRVQSSERTSAELRARLQTGIDQPAAPAGPAVLRRTRPVRRVPRLSNPLASSAYGAESARDRAGATASGSSARTETCSTLAALETGSAVTVFPESAVDDARSQAVLIRLPDGTEGTASGYVAYSRVCTHAGCPVALYRASAKQLMCPCHQSVFDAAGDGAVVSGPADRPLPRLPIRIAGDGSIVATGDFPTPVGPGSWSMSRG